MESPEKQESEIDLTDAVTMRNDHILVRRDAVVHVTKGGIVFPDEGERKAQPLGLVIAVGPGRPLPQGGHEPLDIKPGDRVIYQKASGKAVDTTLLAEFFTLRDHEVIAKIDQAKWDAAIGDRRQKLTEPVALAAPSIITPPSTPSKIIT